MTRLEFHPEALAEFEYAVQHYAEIQVGLGIRFVSTVESALQSMLDAPET